MSSVLLLQKFLQQGISFLETLSEKQLYRMLEKADDAYFHSHKPLLLDTEYDRLRHYVESRLGTSFHKVGSIPAPTTASSKVVLPYYMGSLHKMKTETDISKWVQKQRNTYSTNNDNLSYVISPKLDGVSALVVMTRHDNIRIYTRGDGKVGHDITHLLPHIVDVFTNLCKQSSQSQPPLPATIAIRGELILKKASLNSLEPISSNARNVVAGILQRNDHDDTMKYIDFIGYECIEPSNLSLSHQYEFLSTLRIPCVPYEIWTDLPFSALRKMLESYRSTCFDYDVDGLVVVVDQVYQRNQDKNPTYAMAFKAVMQDQIVQTNVLRVLWNISKDGYLKPRVQIEPVSIHGNTIEYVTGFNAQYIQSHHVGPGAIVEIIRSGDVIPVLKSVVKASNESGLPSTIEYHWNETHTDIIVNHPGDHPEIKEKGILKFFKDIHVDGFGKGRVSRYMECGYDDPLKIVSMTLQDHLKVFPGKIGTMLYENIRSALSKNSMVDVLVASNVFGRGVSKKSLQLLFPSETNHDLDHITADHLSNIKGIGKKTTDAILSHLSQAKEFWSTFCDKSTN